MPASSIKPMPKPSTPMLLLMVCSAFDAFADERGDQILGNAAQTEAAQHDRRAIFDIGHSVICAGHSLIHRFYADTLSESLR